MYGSSFMFATLRPRFSISAPIEAETMPLPSDETTPPVTNTNLVCCAMDDLAGAETSAPGAFYRLLGVRAIADATSRLIFPDPTVGSDRQRRFAFHRRGRGSMIDDPTPRIAAPPVPANQRSPRRQLDGSVAAAALATGARAGEAAVVASSATATIAALSSASPRCGASSRALRPMNP